jgi:ubiquinol-cytochrome c reductase core subunit 2
MRHAANLTTQGASAFGLVKNIQQMGATLTCSTTREYMVYNLECTRDKVDQAVEYLADVTCKPVYFPWEIADSTPQFLLDLGLLAENPMAQLSEALHQAAFRDGLGRSLYMPKHKVGSYTSEQLADYFLRNYTGSNMAFVGTGIDQDSMNRLSSKFRFENNAKSPSSGTGYHGGEVRVEAPGPFVHAAVVTEGAGMSNPECVALNVLQQAMGTAPFVKYSSTPATSRIGKAAVQATDNPVAASSILSVYSDSGLFGFQVSCLADDAEKVLKAVRDAFANATKGSFTDAEVAAAKEQLKSSYLMWEENSGNLVEDIGTQAVSLGAVSPMADALKAIDAVTAADVSKVAKKYINGKPTMAAVGNVAKTPYLDQLL